MPHSLVGCFSGLIWHAVEGLRVDHVAARIAHETTSHVLLASDVPLCSYLYFACTLHSSAACYSRYGSAGSIGTFSRELSDTDDTLSQVHKSAKCLSYGRSVAFRRFALHSDRYLGAANSRSGPSGHTQCRDSTRRRACRFFRRR